MNNLLKSFLGILTVTVIGVLPTTSFAKSFHLDLGNNLGQVTLNITNASSENAIDDFTGTFALPQIGMNGRISDYYRSDTAGVHIVELSWEGSCRGSVSASPEYNANSRTLSLRILGGRDCNGAIARTHLIFNESERTQPVATTSRSFHRVLDNGMFLKLFLTNVTRSDNVDNYTGIFENQQSGTRGTVNTIHNSNMTGVQILEMAWQGSCPGSITVNPSYNAGNRSLTMSILGGNDCNGTINRDTFVMEDCPHQQTSNTNGNNRVQQNHSGMGGKAQNGQNPQEGASISRNPNESINVNGSGQSAGSHAGNAQGGIQGGSSTAPSGNTPTSLIGYGPTNR